MEIRKISCHRSRSSDNAELAFLQKTSKKYTKIHNARAQLLFCSLNLLFGDVLVAVVLVVCLIKFSSVGTREKLVLLNLPIQPLLRQCAIIVSPSNLR